MKKTLIEGKKTLIESGVMTEIERYEYMDKHLNYSIFEPIKIDKKGRIVNCTEEEQNTYLIENGMAPLHRYGSWYYE